jgi:hypothetical protein
MLGFALLLIRHIGEWDAASAHPQGFAGMGRAVITTAGARVNATPPRTRGFAWKID